MICIVSFCDTDRAMALELARHIECLGGVKAHKCILLNPTGTPSADIAAHLQDSFGVFKHVEYKPRLNGWPDGPNQCFAVAAETVFASGWKEPWLWMEADCVTTRPQWLDHIEHEHKYCGQPILGAFESTFGLDGKVVGNHVTGVAVYPWDWWKTCAPLRSIVTATETYRLSGECPPAFDVYLAPYSVPKCALTRTMRHYWKSHSYVEEDGQVTCQFQVDYGGSPKVDMGAALVHGCKDFSLLDIVQRNLCAVQS